MYTIDNIHAHGERERERERERDSGSRLRWFDLSLLALKNLRDNGNV